jgi:hypothetical protein
MPIQQLDNPNPLGSIIGMVGGYLAANPARKAAQKQREDQAKQQTFENTRETNADTRANKELENNTLEATERKSTYEGEQTRAAQETAARATQDQTIGKAPQYDPDKPGPYIAYATKAANYYATQGLAGTDTGKFWASEANKLPQNYSSYTSGQQHVAGAGLDKARAQYIKDWPARAKQTLQDKLKELSAVQGGKERIAASQQAAAFARAQLAHSRSGTSSDERETIAEMAALNAANGADATRAFETAKLQYQGQLKGWEEAQKAGQTAIANDDTPPAGYGQPAPQFNFTMPQQGANAPTIIMVPVPQADGTTKQVPIVTHGQPKSSTRGTAAKTAAKPATTGIAPKAAANKPSAPPAAPAGGGGLVDMIRHALFPSSGAPGGQPGGVNHLKAKNGKGEDIFSDDGGKTWHK